MLNRANNFRAFTLIEMLIVIAIIAILTGIIVANFSQARSKARDGKRVTDLATIQNALEQYFNQCQNYPAPVSVNVINSTIFGSNYSCTAASGATVNLNNFISVIPTPPIGTNQSYYDYYTSGSKTDYLLHAVTEISASQLDSVSNSEKQTSASWAVVNCYDANNQNDYCVSSIK